MILAMTILLLVRLPFLVVSDQYEKTVLFRPLFGEIDFSIYYDHSVHKTPVWENFVPGPGDKLILKSTAFQSLGVGTPFLPEEGRLTNDNGKFILTGIDREFKEINLCLTPVARQSLLFREKRFDLNDYYNPGDSIRIRLERFSAGAALWRLTRGGKLLD